MNQPTVAIVGRPNVGKSTLFNRIVGGRRAIVDDRPGVTRDRHFAQAAWSGHSFWLIDTGGWTAAADGLSSGVRAQIEAAIAESDVVILVVDTVDGVHPMDLEVADILRPLRDRVVVAANKADDLATTLTHHVFHELGLGDPLPLSAAQGRGTGELLDRVVALLSVTELPADTDATQVAVVGRPNVGKSSLMNRLLGHDRFLVAPEPGTTRDAVDSPLRYHGRALNFIDTAGLRKRSKVEDEIEFYSTLRTQRAIERAHVAVVVVDAVQGLERQDLRVAREVWDRGVGLIVAVNKWDLVEHKDAGTAARGKEALASRAPFLGSVPFLYVSAVTGQRVRKLLDVIVGVAERRERRIETSAVNRVLQALVSRNQPPQQSGQEVKLLYGSQVGTCPPTFAIVANRPDAVPVSYVRYLEHGFREAWDFEGVPMRIRLRRRRGRTT